MNRTSLFFRIINKTMLFCLIRLIQFAILFVVSKSYFNKEAFAYSIGLYLLLTPFTFLVYMLINFNTKVKNIKFIKFLMLGIDFVFLLFFYLIYSIKINIQEFTPNSYTMKFFFLYFVLGFLFFLNDFRFKRPELNNEI